MGFYLLILDVYINITKQNIVVVIWKKSIEIISSGERNQVFLFSLKNQRFLEKNYKMGESPVGFLILLIFVAWVVSIRAHSPLKYGSIPEATKYAYVAELVDAWDLKSHLSEVWVRFPS